MKKHNINTPFKRLLQPTVLPLFKLTIGETMTVLLASLVSLVGVLLATGHPLVALLGWAFSAAALWIFLGAKRRKNEKWLQILTAKMNNEGLSFFDRRKKRYIA